MKKLLKNALWLCAAVLLFCSCENDETTSKTDQGSTISSLCCDVTCKRGSCRGYGSPCECTCTLLGKPKCSSSAQSVQAMSDNMFSEDITHVILSEDLIEETTKDQAILRSLNKTYADELADAIEGYKDLVNKYGYELKTKEALIEYYTLTDIEDEYESKFTMAELEIIM